MHSTTRMCLRDLNPHLICVLCGGYLVDATTIIECIHSFCRTCIKRYLESSKYCPICDVQVHKTRPLANVRSDKTLQTLVYKLVPGLFKDEMKRRREYYASHTGNAGENSNSVASCEERGDVMDDDDVSSRRDEDEQISLCLQRCYRPPPYKNGSVCAPAPAPTEAGSQSEKRYLLCPSGVAVGHLKKLLRLKFDISTNYRLEIFYSDESLRDTYTLLDVAHVYAWRRIEPMKLYYIVYDHTILKLNVTPPSVQSRNHGLSRQQDRKRRRQLKQELLANQHAKEEEDGATSADTNKNGGLSPASTEDAADSDSGIMVNDSATVNRDGDLGSKECNDSDIADIKSVEEPHDKEKADNHEAATCYEATTTDEQMISSTNHASQSSSPLDKQQDDVINIDHEGSSTTSSQNDDVTKNSAPQLSEHAQDCIIISENSDSSSSRQTEETESSNKGTVSSSKDGKGSKLSLKKLAAKPILQSVSSTATESCNVNMNSPNGKENDLSGECKGIKHVNKMSPDTTTPTPNSTDVVLPTKGIPHGNEQDKAIVVEKVPKTKKVIRKNVTNANGSTPESVKRKRGRPFKVTKNTGKKTETKPEAGQKRLKLDMEITVTSKLETNSKTLLETNTADSTNSVVTVTDASK